MTGSVRKRGKNWYYSFEASTVDGKRKRIEKVGGRTKKEAETALRIALTEYENAGLHFVPADISMSDYMDYWFETYVLLNCKYNTQNGYERIIRLHIKPTLGIFKLKSLTPATLQSLINDKYSSGLSKNYLNGISNVLSSSLKYAVHPLGFIKSNPMQHVKSPKFEHSSNDDLKIISNKDFNRIIERFPFGSSFYVPIMIGYYTGLRISETMGLTWEDIDLDNATIDVNKIILKRKLGWYFGSTKTESSVRNIKIGKTLINVLKDHKEWQIKNKLNYDGYYTQNYITEEQDPINKLPLIRIHSLQLSVDPGEMEIINMICTKENGELVTPETFKYASRVINKKLQIDFTYHSLRHTHATILIENGANIKDVQKRLGHSKIETTLNIYTTATEKMAERSVDIFEQATTLPTKKQ